MVESYFPKTVEEVVDLLKEDMTIMAGGTDLMVKYKSKSTLPPKLKSKVLFIRGVKSLDYIKVEGEKLVIGANATLSDVLFNENTPDLLKEAVSQMASPGIRNEATLVGNIVNASPAGDSLPVLYLLDTKIVILSSQGERTVDIEDFIIKPGGVDLKHGEFVKEVIVNKVSSTYSQFKKVGTRRADAISKLCFCGMCDVKEGKIKDFRVSFGAVAATIVRKKDIENSLVGKEAKDIDIGSIVSKYENYINPIDDQRSNKKYRKKVSIGLLEGFIKSIKEG